MSLQTSMRAATLALLSILFCLPMAARAQGNELMLTCEYEKQIDSKGNDKPMHGRFSAAVRMQADRIQVDAAKITADTMFCTNFKGFFNDLKVFTECDQPAPFKAHAKLEINRINGEFEHWIFRDNSNSNYSGHCTPAKKLF
jgi:hypothetical protein